MVKSTTYIKETLKNRILKKLNKIRENFLSASLSENETLEVIKKVYEKFSVVFRSTHSNWIWCFRQTQPKRK